MKIVAKLVSNNRTRKFWMIHKDLVCLATACNEIPSRVDPESNKVFFIHVALVRADALRVLWYNWLIDAPELQSAVSGCRDEFCWRRKVDVRGGFLVSLENMDRSSQVTQIIVVDMVISSAKRNVVWQSRMELDGTHVGFGIDSHHWLSVHRRPYFYCMGQIKVRTISHLR